MSMLAIERLVKPKFGKLLRKIRRKRGISLRELATQVGVDHTYIYQIESGKVGAPLGGISLAIARALESPELMERAEHALVRQMLCMELDRQQLYSLLPEHLREELNITDSEQREITDTSSRLVPRLLTAKERREHPSEWKPVSPKKSVLGNKH